MQPIGEPAGPDDFARDFPLLLWLRKHGVGRVGTLEAAVHKGARLRREHLEPAALEIETRAGHDPTYVAKDVLAAACREGWFSMNVPRMLGGQGLPLGAMLIALEEVAAGCLGLANLIAVHGLAVSTVASTGDVAAMAKLSRSLVEGERRGHATLLSTALTEPGAGTDMENARLLRVANLCSEARPVPDGYVLDGRKVFISNGSIADTHVVLMPTDRRRPVETLSAFLVPHGTPGLSVGRVEKKMGQKACPAAELVFEGCFVAAEQKLSGTAVAERSLELVLGATRGAVGVFGAGVARGAYERALQWARSHRIGARRALDVQWVQLRLVEMRRHVMMARAAYLEAMLGNEVFGLASLVQPGWAQRLSALLPRGLMGGPRMRAWLESPRASEGLQRRIGALPHEHMAVSAALGAHAKVTGSDLGMRNCELALEICGADGLRHDRGIEKLLRDAKLLQIYEGTNQLNRIEIYSHLVERGDLHVN